ncbi:DUF2541 family protein [Aeromonas fluvialis]|uniref:DUF2541 family protein n=1 Tax=Aeromonas fluvialis TaxID=591962 RepID=UPI000A594334|nr:DUF2541 family protein [Aeromonas fluvialis]
MFKYVFMLAALLAAPLALADDQFTLGRTIVLGLGEKGSSITKVICLPTQSIKVKAERDLTLDKLVITYSGEKTKTVSFNRKLKEDQETEWKSIGGRLCVKKIQVYGYADGLLAKVKVFGRR